MDLHTSSKITITVDEYDTIQDFSHILQKYCEIGDTCGTCEICRKINSCYDKTQVIDIILYELRQCGVLDIQSENIQWKVIEGNNGCIDYICPRCETKSHEQSNYCPECGLQLGVCNLDA